MNGTNPGRFRDPAVVDFGVDRTGGGRRLERLGGVLVDRPLPQCRTGMRLPTVWPEAAARYVASGDDAGARGGWEFRRPLPDPWRVAIPVGAATLLLEVRPAPSGQLGIFLEQLEQWRRLARATAPGSRMLSLFGHSGAATLALAAAGAEVFHVDASRQALALARRNAEASGLGDRPIHWICDDAGTFVARELRRGRGFAGAVIDPPSWGHGPRGQPFAIDRDLEPLLAAVTALVARSLPAEPGPLVLTSHSPGWHPARLRGVLDTAWREAGLPESAAIDDGPLACMDDTGRPLVLGGYARIAPRERAAPAR